MKLPRYKGKDSSMPQERKSALAAKREEKAACPVQGKA